MQSLKELTALSGVSGNEKEVRDYILNKIKDKADSITVDTMGNVIALKKGNGKSDKKVMVSAHMDEVGLIVSSITEEGCLKFKPVGGIDPRVLVSKKVYAGEEKLKGVIGYKAIHLQTPDERSEAPKMKSLYIDIGAKDKEDAEKHIKKGDYVCFDSEFTELGTSSLKAKALDDRAGCAIMLYLMEKDYDFDVYFTFTVQEETGLRGAKIAANRIDADFALVLEATTCSDVPDVSEKDYSTVLSGGAVLSFMDRSALYDKELVKALSDAAKRNAIPFQYKRTTAGGNDSGAIHKSCDGVRTVSISLPARYIHSPSSVISKNDFFAAKRLAECFLTEVLKNV